MGRKKNEAIRKVFLFDYEKNISKCKNCDKIITGVYFTNLKRHLAKDHPDLLERICEEYEKTEYQSIDEHLKKKKIEIEICENDVVNACVSMVTTENLPFTFLDSQAFRTFSEPIFKGLNMDIINSHSIINIIEKKFEICIERIRDKCVRRVISLKIDSATRHDRQLFCVNLQMIEKKKICVYTLGLVSMSCRMTAENLSFEVERILSRYNITLSQIFSITTDNGRNMAKTAELLSARSSGDSDEDDDEDCTTDEDITCSLKVGNVQSVRCAAHTLQLAVHSFLDEDQIKNIVKKVREKMKCLRSPTHRIGLSQKNMNRPILDVPTRWCSTYDMLDSFLQLRPYWAGSFTDVSEDFLTEVSLIVTTLLPLKEATVKLQKEQLPMGDFLKVWWELRLQIEAQATEKSKKLFCLITERQKALLESPIVLAALYLDPRLRRLFPEEKLHFTQQFLKTLASQIIDAKKPTLEPKKRNEMIPSSTARDDESSHNESLLSNFLDTLGAGSSFVSDDTLTHNDITNFNKEMGEYHHGYNRLSLREDIISYWADSIYKYPFLSEVALTVQGVPATQVTVERAFSAVRLSLQDYRSRLSAENLEKIILLKLNASTL